jgi:hypothetical protein
MDVSLVLGRPCPITSQCVQDATRAYCVLGRPCLSKSLGQLLLATYRLIFGQACAFVAAV